MSKTNKTKKPIKTFKAGKVALSIWENELDSGNFMRLISFNRSYLDKEEQWQSTKTLRISDLPRLNLLIAKAYASEIL